MCEDLEEQTIKRLRYMLDKNNEQIKSFDTKANFIMITYIAFIGLIFSSPIEVLIQIALSIIPMWSIFCLLDAIRPKSSTKYYKEDLDSVTYYKQISIKYLKNIPDDKGKKSKIYMKVWLN